jgi:hypothetical protein
MDWTDKKKQNTINTQGQLGKPAVPKAVPRHFQTRAGERCRVPTFVWRLPHIAAYYASPRGRTLRSEYGLAIVTDFYRQTVVSSMF